MLKEKLELVLNYAPICDACLGRQFAKLLTKTTNEQRGSALRMNYAMYIDSIAPKSISDNLSINISGFSLKNATFSKADKPKKVFKCRICSNLFDKKNQEKLVERIKYSIHGIDFDTFSMGMRLSDELLREEESLWEEAGIDFCEGIKTHLNRNIGSMLRHSLKKKVDLGDPTLAILMDFSTGQIITKTKPIYIKGYCSKYEKMPVLKQFCHNCYGLGCKSCKYMGKSQKSVQEIIERHILVKTLGIESRFHTTGFEPADFLFSGKRPFVIEIKNPKKRAFDLKKIEALTNKNSEIKIAGLKFVEKEDMIKLKSSKFSRTYKIKITLKAPQMSSKIKQILKGKKIKVLKEKTAGRKMELKTQGYARELNDEELIENMSVDIVEFKLKKA